MRTVVHARELHAVAITHAYTEWAAHIPQKPQAVLLPTALRVCCPRSLTATLRLTPTQVLRVGMGQVLHIECMCAVRQHIGALPQRLPRAAGVGVTALHRQLAVHEVERQPRLLRLLHPPAVGRQLRHCLRSRWGRHGW